MRNSGYCDFPNLACKGRSLQLERTSGLRTGSCWKLLEVWWWNWGGSLIWIYHEPTSSYEYYQIQHLVVIFGLPVLMLFSYSSMKWWWFIAEHRWWYLPIEGSTMVSQASTILSLVGDPFHCEPPPTFLCKLVLSFQTVGCFSGSLYGRASTTNNQPPNPRSIADSWPTSSYQPCTLRFAELWGILMANPVSTTINHDQGMPNISKHDHTFWPVWTNQAILILTTTIHHHPPRWLTIINCHQPS